MKNFRFIATIAASGLLASFAAQAYEKDMGYEYHKEDPKEHRFSITGGATYLVPSMNSLSYASVIDTTNAATGGAQPATVYNFNPSYNWGYFLAAGYMITDRYDIQASWTQFNSEASEDGVSATADGRTSYELVTSNKATIDLGDSGDSATAATHETLKTEAFDITIGQYHRLFNTLTARPFAGVAYGKVNSKTVNSYTSNAATGAGDGTETYNSTFSGWGPELGLDAEYTVWSRLGVVGQIAAAFLIGSQEVSSNIFTPGSPAGGGTAAVPPAQTPISVGDETIIVPVLDAKLGLGWNDLYANNSWGLGIEGGYQVAYYFNVVNQLQFGETSGGGVGAVAVGTPGPTNNDENVGIMGPYLNLTLDF